MLQALGPELWLWRDDLRYAAGIGSKWRKLEGALAHASGVITFGGAYSNYLHAVAVWGQQYGIPTIGLVRGLAAQRDNPTLRACAALGMALHIISKREFDEGERGALAQRLAVSHPTHRVVPLGADGAAARVASGTLWRELKPLLPRDVRVFVGAGTGATALGLGEAGADVVAVAAERALPHSSLARLQAQGRMVAIEGAFAELTTARRALVEATWVDHGVLLDPIYTVRALEYAMHHTGPRVVIHTGGLQGWAGMLPQLVGASAGVRAAAAQAALRVLKPHPALLV